MKDTELKQIQEFRTELYNGFESRADASQEIVDALAQSSQVESPVALSEQPVFRRQYPSIYDCLEEGKIGLKKTQATLQKYMPADAEIISGMSAYAIDATPHPRPEAHTLAGRKWLKSDSKSQAVTGFAYSVLVRLLYERTSWVAPLDIQNVSSATTASAVAALQVKLLFL